MTISFSIFKDQIKLKKLKHINDILWLGFDCFCPSVAYGVICDQESTDFIVVKCNSRIKRIFLCKSYAGGGDAKLIKSDFQLRKDSNYAGIYRFLTSTKSKNIVSTFLILDLNTSNLMTYSDTKTNNNYYKNENFTTKNFVNLKLYHSFQLGWWLVCEWWKKSSTDDVWFRLSRILLNSSDNNYELDCVIDNEICAYENKRPSDCFLVDTFAYFTYSDDISVHQFDIARKVWMQKIQMPLGFRYCRDVFSTDESLIFAFSGRRPYFKLRHDNNSWQQLTFDVPPHESFVRWVVGVNGQVLLSVPNERAQRMDMIFGCLDSQGIVPSLQYLCFAKYIQQFDVEEQCDEYFLTKRLHFSNQLIRKCFGPLWTLIHLEAVVAEP